MVRSDRFRPSAGVALLAVAVFIGAWLDAYQLALYFAVTDDVSVWYPPSGVSMAFSLVFGPLYWPLELLGPLIQGICDDGILDRDEVYSAIREIVFSGGVGVLLRTFFDVRVPFRRARDVRVLIIAATFATGLSTAFALLPGQSPAMEDLRVMAPLFVSFWIGNLSGCFFAAPLMVTIFCLLLPGVRPPPGDWRLSPTRERARGLVLVFALSAALFQFDYVFVTAGQPWLLILIPIYLYALTHGFGGAVLGVFVLDLSIILFHRLSGHTSEAGSLQMIVMMVGTASLLIGASISERHQAELRLIRAKRIQAELATRNLTLAKAIDATPVGVLITGPERGALAITYANPAARGLFGESCAGSGLFALIEDQVHQSDHAAALALRRSIAETDRCSLELALGQGEERRVSLDVAPLRRGPSVIAFVVVAVDVTERYRREAAEKERERLVSLGHLAGGIAHEINNLLHPIVNLTADAIADQEDGPADVREPLRIIQSCGRKAGEIVRNILRFARGVPRQGGQSIVIEEAVTEAVAINRQALPRGVTLAFRSSAAGMRAAVGETEVMQVITNLIRNAIQAIGDSGRIDVILDAEGNKLLRLTVADSGTGMDEETKRRLFDPFYTTRPIGEGTGLGLSVVHGIVGDWHGRIAVTSDPGHGAVFTIEFPAADDSVSVGGD